MNCLRKFTIYFYAIILIAFLIKYQYVENTNHISALYESETRKQYDIYIDLLDNTLNLFENNILIKTYPIASGKPTTPSPVGIWKITNKSTWGEGFGGSWMGLNVPW